MSRKKSLALSSIGVLFLLTGCATSVTKIKPLTLSEVTGERLAQMSQAQKQGLIYNYATHGVMIKKSDLLSIKPSDMSSISTLMSKVDKDLEGKSNNSLDPAFANYMLTKFAQTPYQWSQSSVTPVGFDPSTRQYFVDVTYSTTSNLKTVISDSKIPLGSPNQQQMEQSRYDDYIKYLNDKKNGNSSTNSDLKTFTKDWGTIQSVMDNQQGVSLLQRTDQQKSSTGLGKLTYSGLVQDSRFNTGASMTFRFVFKYDYNLGDQTNLSVSSVYLKSYNLNNYKTLLSSFSSSNMTGTEVLSPFINNVINQYNRSVEEGNNTGLYSLFYNYAGVDRYYWDLNKYTYDRLGAYNYKILQRSGTNVIVEVNRINQERAKNTNLSMPTYKETLIYDMVLNSNDKIEIRSVNLLNSTLVGEPLSVVKDVNGISNQIQFSSQSFTSANQIAVENTLKEFSAAVFAGTTSSKAFQATVDDGISNQNLQKMSSYITSIPNPTKKIEYIENWNTKTNVFVRVTIREIFELSDGKALDTQATVDLANLAGSWKVVNYTRTLDVPISATGISSKGAFSVNTK